DLEQIFYLRTLGNADAIREGVSDVEDVVLIGGSYIGCEVAASLAMLGKRCTIVMQEQATLERGFGSHAGRFFQQLLEGHGARVRIEHWDVAFNHGKTAALNMLGKDVPHAEVPYFFSVLGDWGELEYVGPAYEWDEEVMRGSTDEGKFTIFYLKDGVVKGALTFGRSDDLDHARRLITEAAQLGDASAAL